jgi:prepilin-type N-terminal cleavage/methylation domain-containing protein
MNSKGFTFVEVMIAVVIMVVLSMSLINMHSFMSKQGININDKAFASQKAIQMMEELRSLVAGGEQQGLVVLDSKNDGIDYPPVLTTIANITNPADPVSGNRIYGSAWRYCRNITVTKMPNDPFSRTVYVRIYKSASTSATTAGDLLAETMSVFKTVSSAYVPTQVYDLYIIALENVPGWWVALSEIYPTIVSVISDLESRNSGLYINAHWINRLSYGRDPYYTPYVNYSAYASAGISSVYFYPGKMKADDGSDLYYYPSGSFSGKVSIDGVVSNTGQYVLADQYNNAVRYPDEVRIYKSKGQALPTNPPTPEISYRMLLEKMNDPNDNTLQNAIVINLHGELFPLPPTRNYSDAAKDPQNNANIRVVTHPEKISYVSGQNVNLRVYPYTMTPLTFTQNTPLPECTLFFPGINLTSGANPTITSIQKLVGNNTMPYQWETAVSGTDYTLSYVVSNPPSNYPGTELVLNNTPLTHGYYAASSQGLFATKRLYGLEYIPCPNAITDYSLTSGTTLFYDIFSAALTKWAVFKYNGDANEANQSTNPNNLALTTNVASRASAVFANYQINVTSWVATFSYVITPYNNNNTRGEGFAFMFYKATSTYVTYPNPDDGAQYGITTGKTSSSTTGKTVPGYGIQFNDVANTFGIIQDTPGNYLSPVVTPSIDMNDGNVHNVIVRFCNGRVKVYMDYTLTLDYTIASPNYTQKAMGFSAATGSSSSGRAEHDIRAFNFYTWDGSDINYDYTFDNDLSASDATTPFDTALYKPKNTARWKICISGLANGCQEIDTRIGTDLTTGSSSNEPSNLSSTYVWVGTTVPVTETYQFIGDPRHSPYLDGMQNQTYNWYWQQPNTTDYPGFSNAANGWCGGSIYADTPRMYNAFRTGFMKDNTVYNGITGYSFYYFGLGGEMGYDSANGFANGLPISGTPWNSSNTNWDEITSNLGTTGSYARVIAKKDNSWVGLYWIGELYPDSDFATWSANGNLSTNTYYRAHYDVNFTNVGQVLPYKPQKRANGLGCASFFNGTSASGNGPYNHDTGGTNATISTAGQNVTTVFHYPPVSPVKATRPFTLDYGSNYPDEWNSSIYSALRTTLSMNSKFYTANGYSNAYAASAEVQMVKNSNSCYFVMNGLDKEAQSTPTELGRIAMSCVMRQFLDAGLAAAPGWIAQVPLVTITAPLISDQFINPTSINMAWSSAWKGWGGTNYTEAYTSSYTQATPLVYVLKYSSDNGQTWYYCTDNTQTSPGVRDSAHTTTNLSYTWDVSNTAAFPRGTYILSVECYRTSINLHYTYDYIQIYINR